MVNIADLFQLFGELAGIDVRKAVPKKTIYSEISSNEIFRSISLPAEIDPEKVSAVLNNGVLEIFMDKTRPAKKAPVMAKAA